MTRDEGKKYIMTAIEVLNIALDAISYQELVTKGHTCNDCGRACCKYRPRPGERTRINCPHWTRREP